MYSWDDGIGIFSSGFTLEDMYILFIRSLVNFSFSDLY